MTATGGTDGNDSRAQDPGRDGSRLARGELRGLNPPEGLFADLTMIGWTPPPAAPPPRSAIDWSTPDLLTGERFTINDYAVTDQAVEPPRGSGPRGGSTEAERAVFMRTLEGVLRRHGLLAAPAPPPPPPPSASAAAAPTPAATGATNGDGDRRVELDLDPSLAVPLRGRSTLAVAVERSRQPLIAETLAGLGLEPVSSEPTTVTATTSFRGSVSREQRPDPARDPRRAHHAGRSRWSRPSSTPVSSPATGSIASRSRWGRPTRSAPVASPERPPPRPVPVEPVGLVSRR